MSSPAKAQPPKTPRKTSRQANRSVSGSEQQQQQPQNQSRRGGRRSTKGASNHNQQTTQAPEWDSAPANEIQGDFDETGNFVLNGNQAQTNPRRPPSAKKNSSNSANNYYAVSNGQQEMPMSSQVSVLPFPTLRGTPHKPYAGPTFHASPAASALPMPKFYSKSVPNIASTSQTMQARAEEESDEHKASESSDALDDSPSMPQAQPLPSKLKTDSPLDVFFSADRAEKAKQKPQTLPASEPRRPASVQVPQAAPSHWASIYGSARPAHTRNQSADSTSRGMFMMELDGGNGPRHATPPQGRSMGHRATTEPATLQHMAHVPHNKASPGHLNSLYQVPNHGISTPVLPSEMEGSPAARAGSVPTSHQNIALPPPRSADSTPLHTPPLFNGYNQAHHYGNRNLSPLFQAARNTPRTQSQLRQEFEPASPTPVNELPGSLPSHRRNLPMGPADAAARKFLSDMINQAPADSSARTPPSNMSRSPAHAFPQYGTPPHGHTPEPHPLATMRSSSYQNSGNISKAGNMEADLKRMLNITGK